MLGGRRVDATNRATWKIASLRHRPQPLALPGDVAEATTAQATPWQPTSCNTVRVGEAVEASVVKHCRDPPALYQLFLAMLNLDDRRLRLQPWETLLPPIGAGAETRPRRPRCWRAGIRPSTGRAGKPYTNWARGWLRLLRLRPGSCRLAPIPPRPRAMTGRVWVRDGDAATGIAGRRTTSR